MTSLRALLAYNIKERRRTLGLSQATLAEKVSTSTHYIGQIEQQNKFPSPEMLQRIAAALDIDSPQLFSMTSFSDEAIKNFQTAIQSDIETSLTQAIAETVTQAINTRISELKKTD
jgi:transcriptional regulator with XRE-family HTH domain